VQKRVPRRVSNPILVRLLGGPKVREVRSRSRIWLKFAQEDWMYRARRMEARDFESALEFGESYFLWSRGGG